MISLAEYILAQEKPVAPYALQNLFGLSPEALQLQLDKPENHLVLKTKLGYCTHKYTTIIEEINNSLKEKWMIPFSDLCETANSPSFKDYLTLLTQQGTDNRRLFLFKQNNDWCIKKKTLYNIYNMPSLLAAASKHGLGGLNLEDIYSEYDDAFEDVETLVEEKKLIRTKTRVYSVSAAALP